MYETHRKLFGLFLQLDILKTKNLTESDFFFHEMQWLSNDQINHASASHMLSRHNNYKKGHLINQRWF